MGNRHRKDVIGYNATHVALSDNSIVPRIIKVNFQGRHDGLSMREAEAWEQFTGTTCGAYNCFLVTLQEPYGVGEHLLRNRSFGK